MLTFTVNESKQSVAEIDPPDPIAYPNHVGKLFTSIGTTIVPETVVFPWKGLDGFLSPLITAVSFCALLAVSDSESMGTTAKELAAVPNVDSVPTSKDVLLPRC
jgi:hypothetical protein